MKRSDNIGKIIPIRPIETETEYIQPTTEEDKSTTQRIETLFDTLLDKVKLMRPRRTLEQIAKMCSEKMDALIIREESQNHYTYIGGRFIIFSVDEKSFRLVAELYFKNHQDEWVEVKSTSQPRNMEYLTKDSVIELLSKGQVAFEIEEPKRG